MGLKVSLILGIFIWIRGTYRRLRYDQLIELLWKKCLRVILGYCLLVPSLI
jgi:NADH-ubiquinone oxidoreductase chain 1